MLIQYSTSAVITNLFADMWIVRIHFLFCLSTLGAFLPFLFICRDRFADNDLDEAGLDQLVMEFQVGTSLGEKIMEYQVGTSLGGKGYGISGRVLCVGVRVG